MHSEILKHDSLFYFSVPCVLVIIFHLLLYRGLFGMKSTPESCWTYMYAGDKLKSLWPLSERQQLGLKRRQRWWLLSAVLPWQNDDTRFLCSSYLWGCWWNLSFSPFGLPSIGTYAEIANEHRLSARFLPTLQGLWFLQHSLLTAGIHYKRLTPVLSFEKMPTPSQSETSVSVSQEQHN